MADFSQDIKNFQRFATYTYEFDNVGNMTFDSSSSDFSQVFLAFPLRNIFYNNPKINSFFDATFVEFVPQPVVQTTESVDNLQQQLDVVQQENVTLKTQLDSLISQNESSGSVADQMATKQVILELRKMLGQGRVDSDFSTDFPYTPIRKSTT
jgi:hypothetical protein